MKANPGAVTDSEFSSAVHLAIRKEADLLLKKVKDSKAKLLKNAQVVTAVKHDYFSRRIRVEKNLQEAETELYWARRGAVHNQQSNDNPDTTASSSSSSH
jgi:Txe/YoeB family toxin of Txe-Axe toxin-antitoxin module